MQSFLQVLFQRCLSHSEAGDAVHTPLTSFNFRAMQRVVIPAAKLPGCNFMHQFGLQSLLHMPQILQGLQCILLQYSSAI